MRTAAGATVFRSGDHATSDGAVVRTDFRRKPSAGLGVAAVWLMSTATLGWLLLLLVPHQSVRSAIIMAAVVAVPALGLWVVANAATRGRGFLGVMTFVVVLVSDATLRGGIERGLDLQSVGKAAIWGAGLLLLIWRRDFVGSVVKHFPSLMLLVFGFWALATTAYSVTPLYTAAAALSFLGMWVLATNYARMEDETRALAVITWSLLTGLALSLLLWAIVPDRVMTPMENGAVLRLSGVMGSPNTLGRAAALGLLLATLLCLRLSRRAAVWTAVVAVGLCFACLYLSGSRASTLGLLAGLAVLALRRRPWVLITSLVLMTCFALVLYLSPSFRFDVFQLISRTGKISEVTTFTGRTDIWAFVLDKIREAPLIGYGFGSTREVIAENYFGSWGWTTTSAHNLWLQAWITTGLIGLAPLIAGQIGSLREFVIAPNPVRDSIVVFVLVLGLFEASALGPSVNLITFVLIWGTALTAHGSAGVRTQPTERARAEERQDGGFVGEHRGGDPIREHRT